MAIMISQFNEPERFKSQNLIHAHTSDNKELITLTGIVLAHFPDDFEGLETWKYETLDLNIKFPNIIPDKPDKKALKVEQWAPFITINTIYNTNHAVNAGWGVEEFWGPGPITITTSITLSAKVAVRDDGRLYRVGYSVTLKGVFVDYEQPPIG